MDAEQFIKLIEELPPYLCYIYPGYITMFLIYFFRELTLSETNAKFIKSVIISYFYVVYLKEGLIPSINILFHTNMNLEGNSIIFHILLIAISVIISYIIYYMLDKSEIVEKIIKRLGIRTTTDKNEIDMLQKKYSDTIWIYVYLKNSNFMYEGSLTDWELENGKNKFFCLSKYRKSLINNDGKISNIEDHSDNDKEKVLIYFDAISYFEVANVNKS